MPVGMTTDPPSLYTWDSSSDNINYLSAESTFEALRTGYVILILSKMVPLVSGPFGLISLGGRGSQVMPGIFGLPVWVSLSTPLSRAANMCRKRAKKESGISSFYSSG